MPWFLWNVVRHERLFDIHVLVMLARGATLDLFFSVTADVSPEHGPFGSKLAFLCTLVCIV